MEQQKSWDKSTSNDKSRGNMGAVNFQSELKIIGDKIESIANQMKNSANADKAEVLRKLGNQVEHFMDSLASSSGSSKLDTKTSSKSSNADFASDEDESLSEDVSKKDAWKKEDTNKNVKDSH